MYLWKKQSFHIKKLFIFCMKNINNKSKKMSDDIIIRKINRRKENVFGQVIGMLAIAIFMIMAIDAMFFFAWVMSGQNPGDGFYFGAITANIIKTFIL